MTTETVHDKHFDSFVGAGESPLITTATPAANRTFTAARCPADGREFGRPSQGTPGQTRSAKAEKISSAAARRTCFLRPSGSRAMPYRTFASVMAVVRSSRLSRSRAQLSTPGAGSGRISSETTFVSRMIMRRNPRRGLGHALHLPELRYGAVDRRVLLADDRRTGGQLAEDADGRPDPARRPVRRRPPGTGPCSRYPMPRWWRGRRARESRADRAAATPMSVSESGAVKLRSLPSRCSAHSRCRSV
jgi:hypothetical protein